MPRELKLVEGARAEVTDAMDSDLAFPYPVAVRLTPLTLHAYGSVFDVLWGSMDAEEAPGVMAVDISGHWMWACNALADYLVSELNAVADKQIEAMKREAA